MQGKDIQAFSYLIAENIIIFIEFAIFLFTHSDAGNQDRVVIQELIKTVAQSQLIQSSTQRDFKGRQFSRAGMLLNEQTQ